MMLKKRTWILLMETVLMNNNVLSSEVYCWFKMMHVKNKNKQL